jgi:hypothetical protein
VSIRVQRLCAEHLCETDWLNRLAPIGEAAAREYGRKWDADHFFGHWWETLSRNSGFFLVALEVETPIGVLTGNVWADDFSGEPTIAKTHWYVIPEARGTSAGFRLWREFEKLANGYPRALISCPPNVEADQTSFYTKRGFKIGSRVFEKA